MIPKSREFTSMVLYVICYREVFVTVTNTCYVASKVEGSVSNVLVYLIYLSIYTRSFKYNIIFHIKL